MCVVVARENCKDLSQVMDYGQGRWVKRKRLRSRHVESGEHTVWSGDSNEISATGEDRLS